MKFEYITQWHQESLSPMSTEEFLNRLGAEGWELVTIHNQHSFVFKRAIGEKKPRPANR